MLIIKEHGSSGIRYSGFVSKREASSGTNRSELFGQKIYATI